MTKYRVVVGLACLALFSAPSLADAAQATPAAASTAPAIERVDPAALVATPDDYAGRTVSFTVMASGGLTREANGRLTSYIDDYDRLSPVLEGDVLRKWLKADFSPERDYPITFTGHVLLDPDNPFVYFAVEDFSLGLNP